MTENTPTKTIDRVCVSPGSKESICLLCAKDIENKDYKRRLIAAGNRKSKACLNLELLLGQEFSVAALITNILCRNCADKNETLVKKIIDVRSKFESSAESIGENRKKTSVKRLSRLEPTINGDCEGDRSHTSKRALFETEKFGTESCIVTPTPIPRTREACSQVNESDFDGEKDNLTQVNFDTFYKRTLCKVLSEMNLTLSE